MSTTSTHYRTEVDYAAPAGDVFAALARPDLWWTTDGAAAASAGDLIRLNWSAGDFVAFRVDEFDPPRSMRWTCVAQRDGNLPEPDEWVGTTLVFEVAADGTLGFEHLGLAPQLECFDLCAGGWDFFLRHSVRSLIATGAGRPHEATTPLGVVRAYHAAWTSGRYSDAGALLDPAVTIEVPVNAYDTRDAFMQAVAGFGAMTERVELLAAGGGREDAQLLYDMRVQGLGEMRVAEHFTVAGGRIVRLRQIHDTHAIRAAGLGS